MNNITLNRSDLKTIVFSLYLILLVYKFLNGELLFQHTNPPIIYPILNFPYWLFILSGLKDFIFSSNLLKTIITLSLFSASFLSIIKTKSTFYPKIFCFSIWLYQFLYFSIVAYQPFAIGILFPCLPFIFKDDFKFTVVFNFGRYFFCGLYFLAGVLKIVNGGIFNIYQMSDSIKMSCLDYMLYNPTSLKTDLMSFFLYHYKLGYLLYLGAALLEMGFILGFLTKKFDYILFILFLIFHFSNYMLLDLPFTNHFIILAFLLPLRDDLLKYYTKNI
ncbi:hypothetical protein A5893_03715 [Pedobacter psychrophilus]|uniref:HTTM domain-containing protein n=1 Tax=Pedobacter psychrophilus TaxID=1826909 RepID=A0A179DME0_9SPHI|nr:hypothetical protein [Pedobacter psychrophilus]OAQ42231.1 hypothetical protein A5893_03715 [Pedobacter psychrophilus]